MILARASPFKPFPAKLSDLNSHVIPNNCDLTYSLK